MNTRRFILWTLTFFAPWLGLQTAAQASGTVRLDVQATVVNLTCIDGRALAGNTAFTPSLWHEDKPSGPFNTCVKAYHVNIAVNKLIYPFRSPSDADGATTAFYDVGTPDADGTYRGLCIFNPTDLKLWDHRFEPFPDRIITSDEAATFCSKPENQR